MSNWSEKIWKTENRLKDKREGNQAKIGQEEAA